MGGMEDLWHGHENQADGIHQHITPGHLLKLLAYMCHCCVQLIQMTVETTRQSLSLGFVGLPTLDIFRQSLLLFYF